METLNKAGEKDTGLKNNLKKWKKKNKKKDNPESNIRNNKSNRPRPSTEYSPIPRTDSNMILVKW